MNDNSATATVIYSQTARVDAMSIASPIVRVILTHWHSSTSGDVFVLETITRTPDVYQSERQLLSFQLKYQAIRHAIAVFDELFADHPAKIKMVMSD